VSQGLIGASILGGASAGDGSPGSGLALSTRFVMEGMKFWNQYPAKKFEQFKGAVLSCDVGPVLRGSAHQRPEDRLGHSPEALWRIS